MHKKKSMFHTEFSAQKTPSVPKYARNDPKKIDLYPETIEPTGEPHLIGCGYASTRFDFTALALLYHRTQVDSFIELATQHTTGATISSQEHITLYCVTYPLSHGTAVQHQELLRHRFELLTTTTAHIAHLLIAWRAPHAAAPVAALTLTTAAEVELNGPCAAPR